MAFLPPRILELKDHIGFIRDFSFEENFGIVGVEGIFELNKTTNGHLEKMFQNVTCSPQGREAARNLLSVKSVFEFLGNMTRVVETYWKSEELCPNQSNRILTSNDSHKSTKVWNFVNSMITKTKFLQE